MEIFEEFEYLLEEYDNINKEIDILYIKDIYIKDIYKKENRVKLGKIFSKRQIIKDKMLYILDEHEYLKDIYNISDIFNGFN